MEYVLSQVLVVIAFIFLSITYIINKRRLILFFSILASAFFIGSYYFLGAWSGLAMSVISISRSILFLINNKCYTKITLFDWIVLACSIIALGVCAVVTYDGLLSLCAVIAETIYAISVCQKNDKIYKILGLITSIFWIAYNIFINSIFGIILQIILFAVEIFGLVKVYKNNKTQ